MACRTRISERQAGRKRKMTEPADSEDFEPGSRRPHRRAAPLTRNASGRDLRRGNSGRRFDQVPPVFALATLH